MANNEVQVLAVCDAESLRGASTEEARAPLQKVLAVAKDERVRRQASEILAKISPGSDKAP